MMLNSAADATLRGQLRCRLGLGYRYCHRSCDRKYRCRLSRSAKNGISPEGIALSADEQTLYVANAHANTVAVVQLAKAPTLKTPFKARWFYSDRQLSVGPGVSLAIACLSRTEKAPEWKTRRISLIETGMYPNMPNGEFPGDRYNKQGMHPDPLVEGNISLVTVPDEKSLVRLYAAGDAKQWLACVRKTKSLSRRQVAVQTRHLYNSRKQNLRSGLWRHRQKRRWHKGGWRAVGCDLWCRTEPQELPAMRCRTLRRMHMLLHCDLDCWTAFL